MISCALFLTLLPWGIQGRYLAVKTQKMVSVTRPPSLPVVDERRIPEASSWYSTTGGSGRALTLVGVVGESGGM